MWSFSILFGKKRIESNKNSSDQLFGDKFETDKLSNIN